MWQPPVPMLREVCPCSQVLMPQRAILRVPSSGGLLVSQQLDPVSLHLCWSLFLLLAAKPVLWGGGQVAWADLPWAGAAGRHRLCARVRLGGFLAHSPSWVKNWGWGRGVRACPGQCSSPGSNQEESRPLQCDFCPFRYLQTPLLGLGTHRSAWPTGGSHPATQTSPLLCGGQARDATARRAWGAQRLLHARPSAAQHCLCTVHCCLVSSSS